MKIYIAGKITDNPKYQLEFGVAESVLRTQGHIPMNPACLPPGFEHHEYMQICFNMIEVCEAVYMLNNWKDSKGAVMEHEYAKSKDKWIKYQKEVEA